MALLARLGFSQYQWEAIVCVRLNETCAEIALERSEAARLVTAIAAETEAFVFTAHTHTPNIHVSFPAPHPGVVARVARSTPG